MKRFFIKASEAFNTFEKEVAAPYIRKKFTSAKAQKAKVKIASCGFYKLFINGEDITKGLIAPYISNPEMYIYYDEYNVLLNKGDNTVGIILGNGFQNNPGGYIWDFDKASFRSAPLVSLEITFEDGSVLTSDKSFKTHPSPILSDDYRFGEKYDATKEIKDWHSCDFDDENWDNVIEVEAPSGELKLCEADPIVFEKELSPVKIMQVSDGYIYDFGECNAGISRLNINGEKGQKITLQYADDIQDGELVLTNLWFVRTLWERDREIIHKDTYICKGEESETYEQSFTYHGFRYIKVCGIKPEQATKGLLTYLVYHSKLDTRGDFVCSDGLVNTLQQLCRRSVVSNFHYFPEDCPHREKNGWTGDAALSCEHTLLNFEPDNSYKEWLYNICKSQKENGQLPGIVPTTGWGYAWGNGPCWDRVLVILPYYLYVYRGELECVKLVASSVIKYIEFIDKKRDGRGLIEYGLGDWLHAGRPSPKAPLVLVGSVAAMDMAYKAAFLFDKAGLLEERDYAKNFADSLKSSIRENLIDFETYNAHGSCQGSQVLCIFYNVFEESEKPEAFKRLLEYINEANGHIDIGMIGARGLFYVLSEFGKADLALEMITRPDAPSWANFVERGATTLWENFAMEIVKDSSRSDGSTNHHCHSHISGWFIKSIAGICFNPNKDNLNEVLIKPQFAKVLNFAEGYHICPSGKIFSRWEREGDGIVLTLEIPNGMSAVAQLPDGYTFENGETEISVKTGEYIVKI